MAEFVLYEDNVGLRTTQLVTEGVPAAVAERDGPFGDYSQRPKT